MLEFKQMSETKKMQNLHQRAVKGETLTAEEQTKLQNWYQTLDREEDAILNGSKSDTKQITQDEFDRILFEEGFLANLPNETDEEDDFEPVEFTGKPISETIIEERR